MDQKSTAAGLWGKGDYEQMLTALRSSAGRVKVRMTVVDGNTRRNVTIVDTARKRDMHLRDSSQLASPGALRSLKAALKTIVGGNSVCIFAGAIPRGKLTGEVGRIIEACSERGAKVALDTSGPALKKFIDTGEVWLIKPNVEEFCRLLGEQIRDRPASLVKAGRRLLKKVDIVLISREEKGGLVVTKQGTWQGRCTARRKASSTVGCGDYLVAGFLKGLKGKSDFGFALKTAIAAATAKAWGWADEVTWPKVERGIKVQVSQM
jgi:fructose-1-phosphate kinase PfkB-like protein